MDGLGSLNAARAAALAALALHALVYAFLWTGPRAEPGRTPIDRPTALAARNRRRTARFILVGAATALTAAVCGAVPWRPALDAFVLGLHLVLLPVEILAVRLHRRILATPNPSA